jgi:hypothetical protein
MESHMSLRSEFVTNKKGETVAKALAGYAGLAHNVELNLGQYQPGGVGAQTP